MQPIIDLLGGFFILLDAVNWLYTTAVVLYYHKPTEPMFINENSVLLIHFFLILITQGVGSISWL